MGAHQGIQQGDAAPEGGGQCLGLPTVRKKAERRHKDQKRLGD
jgi:hypothetical protein